MYDSRIIGFTKRGKAVFAIAGHDPTATLTDLTAERTRVRDEGLTAAEAYEAEGTTDEQRVELRTTLRTSATRLEELDGLIAEAGNDGDAIGRLRAARAADEARARGARPALYGAQGGDGGSIAEFLSPGETFVASDAYRGWMEQFPQGGPTAEGTRANSNGVDMGMLRAALGLRTATDRYRASMVTPEVMRALVTSDTASAGEWVRPLWRGLLEPGLVRPLTVRDLVTVLPVSTDAIEYIRENSRVNNAQMVADATALTGSSGLKPEGGLTFQLVTDTVKTIAEWVPATKRILSDAPALRSYIDGYLTDELAIELEDQMVSGDGTGENFLGMLEHPDINLVTTGGSNNLDRIRRAKRVIQVLGFTNPTGVVANPEDIEEFETIKAGAGAAADGGGGYYAGGPFVSQPTTMWGMRLVESQAVPSGTVLVGDFRRAILFDRESTTISVGTVNDDFIRNLVRVLAELRAGFGILRPKAFAAVTMA